MKGIRYDPTHRPKRSLERTGMSAPHMSLDECDDVDFDEHVFG